MIPARWRKVLADLWSSKVRSGLMLLTISVSVFAVGFIITTGDLSTSDMDADFAGSNGHSAIIYTAPAPDLEPSLRRVEGVAQVEQRGGVSARWVLGKDTFQPIEFIAVPAVAEIAIDRLKPVDPPVVPPLRDRQVLLASSAMQVMKVNVGETITVELPNEKRRSLKVVGVVHDVYAISPMFGGAAMAYTTPATIEWLGGSRDFTQVYLTVREKPSDREHVTAVAQAAADKISDAGVAVGYTSVYNPGRHFAKDIFQGVTMILYILGGLTVFLGAFLVINSITALLNQHIRHIGIMKAVGGERGQIAEMYLALVLCLGALSLALMVYPAALAGYFAVQMLGDMLNFIVRPFHFSPAALACQAAVALGIPVLAAVAPVWNGTRITVREAISSHGLGKGNGEKKAGLFARSPWAKSPKAKNMPPALSAIPRWLADTLRAGLGQIGAKYVRYPFPGEGENVEGSPTIPATGDTDPPERALLPRPVLLSLRNTFGRKARLALTLITLTLAGAVFIAVFNLWASFRSSTAEVIRYYSANVTVYFGQPTSLDKVSPLIRSVPGVTRIEGWDSEMGKLLTPDGQNELEVILIAQPNDSRLVEPALTSGRWLLPTDENAIVIGNHILKERPDLKTGDSVVIKINEKEIPWKIVGTYRLVGNFNPPPAYVNYDYFSRVLNHPGKVSSARIITNPPTAAMEARAAAALDAVFKEENVQTAYIRQGEEWRAQQLASFDVMIYFLMVMAAMIAVVGGLGLAGTMSMNVFERSREIGVMRAVGAANGSILQMVLVEVLLIGVISWGLAFVLAIPVTYALNIGVGMAVFNMPMGFAFGFDGVALWLGGILVISALAGSLPAANAMRLTIREVLAYE